MIMCYTVLDLITQTHWPPEAVSALTKSYFFFLFFFLKNDSPLSSCAIWIKVDAHHLLSIEPIQRTALCPAGHVLVLLIWLCGWKMIWGGEGDFSWVQSITCILVVHWWFCINTRVLILEKINIKSEHLVHVWLFRVGAKKWCGSDDCQLTAKTIDPLFGVFASWEFWLK